MKFFPILSINDIIIKIMKYKIYNSAQFCIIIIILWMFWPWLVNFVHLCSWIDPAVQSVPCHAAFLIIYKHLRIFALTSVPIFFVLSNSIIILSLFFFEEFQVIFLVFGWVSLNLPKFYCSLRSSRPMFLLFTSRHIVIELYVLLQN